MPLLGYITRYSDSPVWVDDCGRQLGLQGPQPGADLLVEQADRIKKVLQSEGLDVEWVLVYDSWYVDWLWIIEFRIDEFPFILRGLPGSGDVLENAQQLATLTVDELKQVVHEWRTK